MIIGFIILIIALVVFTILRKDNVAREEAVAIALFLSFSIIIVILLSNTIYSLLK